MRIRRVLARAAAALTVALALLVVSPALPTAGTAPAASAATPGASPAGVATAPACPSASAPGPAVDASEAPRPGGAAPAPLPLPDPPVGGDSMGTCGVVAPAGAPAPPEVGSVSYVVADLDSGAVLAAKVPHARLRPASLLKTLTGLLAARLPMDQVITGTADDANQEGTRVGMGPGGQYTVRQLLDAMLMASGNDTAHALAVRLTGGVDSTVALMNRTAANLGALDTRAATPSGLDGAGMSTSAYDLASIFRVAMREPEFARAVSTKQMTFPGFGATPPYQVDNDNKLLGVYPGFLGGKTGFTDDARHTYLGSAQRDGRRLVVVLMRGEQRPVPMVAQASALLDYGFALPANSRVGTLTEAAPGTLVVDRDGIVGPATLDPVDASGATTTSRWGTPFVVGTIVLVALLIAGLRVRRG